MSKLSKYSWSGLGLALSGIDAAIENLGWTQGINDMPKMYQEQINQLRGIRVRVIEDLRLSLKQEKEDRK